MFKCCCIFNKTSTTLQHTVEVLLKIQLHSNKTSTVRWSFVVVLLKFQQHFNCMGWSFVEDVLKFQQHFNCMVEVVLKFCWNFYSYDLFLEPPSYMIVHWIFLAFGENNITRLPPQGKGGPQTPLPCGCTTLKKLTKKWKRTYKTDPKIDHFRKIGHLLFLDFWCKKVCFWHIMWYTQ